MIQRDFVFLDTETTGAHPLRDRITEVGLYVVLQGRKEQVWNQLINPGVSIPYYIERLTGISDELVKDAPRFDEIAGELAYLLKDKVMVAHNARFDYAFLKNEFKRCGIDFREKTLCTVKLSRTAFPDAGRHSLDAIKARYNLVANGRHRALADVELMYQFFQMTQNCFAEADFSALIASLIKAPSLPSSICIDDINKIPNTAGIYKFYDEVGQIIYIGKSVSLRDRILSHFNADHSSYKEMRLAQQVRNIVWTETIGEFGALLTEALQVKEELPVHNRRLRRHKNLFTIKLETNALGYHTFKVMDFEGLDEQTQVAELYGVFRTRTDATLKLKMIAKTYQLCEKVMGLEKSRGSCFHYQLKKCRGACMGVEPAALYNLRLKTAFVGLEYKAWPYQGAIALIEECAVRERRAYYLFNAWRYLGTALSEADLQMSAKTDAIFDIDVYKLLKKYLPLFRERQALLEL